MVDHHHPDFTESKPLNTELETLAPETTAQHDAPSSESTDNQHAEVSSPENTPAAHNPVETATVAAPVAEAQDRSQTGHTRRVPNTSAPARPEDQAEAR